MVERIFIQRSFIV